MFSLEVWRGKKERKEGARGSKFISSRIQKSFQKDEDRGMVMFRYIYYESI